MEAHGGKVLKCEKTTEEKLNMPPYCSCGGIQGSGRLSTLICLELATLTKWFSQNNQCILLARTSCELSFG